jgi:TPR repeat protein
MEAFLIIVLFCCVLFWIFTSNIGKDPSQKTNAQLLKLYELHKKRVEATQHFSSKQHEISLKEMSVLTDEMRSRGLLSDTILNDDNFKQSKEVKSNTGNLTDPVDQYNKACEFIATKDYKQAVKWLLKSAKGGNPDALYALAFAHVEGRIERNEEQCYMWFCLAASKGHEHALKALPVISKQFTEEQMKKGEKLATAFERDNYP